MTQPLDLASSCHQVLVEVLGPLLYRWDEGSVEDEGRFWGFCSLRALSFNIQWFSSPKDSNSSMFHPQNSSKGLEATWSGPP